VASWSGSGLPTSAGLWTGARQQQRVSWWELEVVGAPQECIHGLGQLRLCGCTPRSNRSL
jgi:hypothetical protein